MPLLRAGFRLAQPALSQQIKQLEDEIGVALFARNHHKVELTAAGKVFYARAQTILKEARQAIANVRAVEQGVVYRPLADISPSIELIAAWRRDNNSPLLARVVKQIKTNPPASLVPISLPRQMK